MFDRPARIAVVSPSGISQTDRLDAGLACLRAWGHEPTLLPHARSQHRYLAGTDAERLADLRAAFDGSWDAVWMARGGYGLARLLPALRLETLAPVPLFGFSDGTVLLNWLAAAGRPAVHAPVLHALQSHNDEPTRQHLRTLLEGARSVCVTGQLRVEGEADGRLLGGNLCMLASACGTPFQLDCTDAIVLLEEVGEVPYKVDRLLLQCLQAGVFRGARGFVLGDFLHNAPNAEGWDVHTVLLEHLAPLGVPVLSDVAVGHGPTNLALPLGRLARLRGNTLQVEAGA